MVEELLTPAQAADVANCHQDTIRRAAEFGLLKAQRVGHMWVIRLPDLQEWIAEGRPNHRRKSTRKSAEETSENAPDESSE